MIPYRFEVINLAEICAKPCQMKHEKVKRVCVILKENHSGLHLCGGHYHWKEGTAPYSKIDTLHREISYYRRHITRRGYKESLQSALANLRRFKGTKIEKN